MSQHLHYRNGFQPWKVQLRRNGGLMLDSQGNKLEFVFPKCNEAGFIETYTPESITKKTFGRKTINRLFGWDTTFTANYERYTPDTVLDYLQIIVDYWQERELHPIFEIIICPRLDKLDRIFSVYPSMETIRVAIMKGGIKTQGNKGLIIQFNSVDISPKLPIGNPNHISYSGNFKSK